MAYFSKGHNIDDEADDFDEYDPTPYGGGYDIRITYGHPLPPSDEICHPPSQNYSDEPADDFSYADVSGYDNDDAINNEYSSYTRRPGYGSDVKNQDEEEEVVEDEYEEPEKEEEQEETQGYGRSEEDEYGGRKNYGGDNYGGEEDEEKEHYRRTYYDD
ncbi:hypothetical protein DCAR_0312572 [Daucus carota subsp. sativus]|uniref:Uncharacterized protein n=1 Tax=Daucus carota subsp. sativus TaxID=79200 RepID=A0A161XZS1_DAUCS|nr:PREDICTED: uncharacterized protein At5g39570 [Daucus carota subsp. sativus]WOG93291.1 hypothetical protein DCAR_0312572 [Daucus carota subsp. sativus]